jgi:hypothetical protein
MYDLQALRFIAEREFKRYDKGLYPVLAQHHTIYELIAKNTDSPRENAEDAPATVTCNHKAFGARTPTLLLEVQRLAIVLNLPIFP